MAKPLGPKSLLIRQALQAHPDKQNTELAGMLNAAPERKTDKLKVTAGDVAAQKQAMKKTGATKAKVKRGPRATKAMTPAATKSGPQKMAAYGNPVDVIDKAYALAGECGGFDNLKRLVERLSGGR